MLEHLGQVLPIGAQKFGDKTALIVYPIHHLVFDISVIYLHLDLHTSHRRGTTVYTER